MPAQEAFQGGAGVLLLLAGLPGRVEGEGVPDGVEALHEDGEVGGGPAGGDLVGQDVDDVAEALGGGGGGVGLDLAAEEPLEGAGVGELVQGGAGEGHGPLPVAERDAAAGGLVQAPPALRVRGGDQRAVVLVGERGEAGEAAGGGVAQDRGGLGVDGGGAEFGDERGYGERPARPAGDVLRGDAEFGEEAGGLVPVVGGSLDGGDDEAVAGAGGGDVEQAAFLGEERAGGEGFGEAVAADAVGFEEGTAAAQVGPEALLDAGHDDEGPLQALGTVGGHQPYGVGAGGLAGEGVGGDVLGFELFEEVERAAAAGTFLRAGGGVEEGAHRVEVAVGVAAGRAAAAGAPLQALGPGVPSQRTHRASSAVPPPSSSSRALRRSRPRRCAPRA
ncbi:hypothetical protein GCM10020254_32280 [Streptomyces goshikiensis]